MENYQEVLFPAPTEKYCYVCKRILPESEFAKNSTKPGEIRPECRTCDNKQRQDRMRREKARDPEAVREKYLQKKYSISLAKYTEILIEQDGKCWICQNKKDLVVDHDHATGEVRGLLCNLCNTSLGGFKDEISSLERAILYLSKSVQL